jgi:hypothetical protein
MSTAEQQRIIDQHADLRAKAARLNDQILAESFKALPEAERDQMTAQYAVMHSEATALAERIKEFTPPPQRGPQ